MAADIRTNPFGLAWLDSCLHETLLPSGPWHKVKHLICTALSKELENQMDNPDRKQALLETLGPHFVAEYFPSLESDTTVFDSSSMSPMKKKQILLEARTLLQQLLKKVCEESQCMRPNASPAKSEEMKEFEDHTKHMVTVGVERMLFLLEREFIHKKKDEAWKEYKKKHSREKKLPGAEQSRRSSDATVRGILKNGNAEQPPRTASSVFSAASSKPPRTAEIKAKLERSTLEPNPFWGRESNALGKAVVAILQRDPKRFTEVASQLQGRQLPESLRTYIWLHVLFSQIRRLTNNRTVEMTVREQFGKAVSRGISSLRIKRATHSDISGLIDNAVIELYDNTPSMLPYIQDNKHMKEAARTLNILYVYNRSYEPYLVFWLFPLQLAFETSTAESDHVYELAMYLDLLMENLFPKWDRIFALAEKAVLYLKEEDLEFYDHLHKIAQIEPIASSGDFLINIIHQEKSKASELLNGEVSKRDENEISAQLLADPVIFLRKWIGEGFVSILDTWAALWTWDQFFLKQWDTDVMIDVCIILLLLLRPVFMKATNYNSMKEVFLKEPCKLYTLDIQRAWNHLRSNLPLIEIPQLNRRIKDQEPVKVIKVETPSPEPPVAFTPMSKLPPVGMKDMQLQIEFISDVIKSEKWIKLVTAGSIHLAATLNYGGKILASQNSSTKPVLLDTENKTNGDVVYHINLPFEIFKFEDLDISPQMHDAKEEPVILVKVEYLGVGSSPILFGWSKIYPYRHGEDPKNTDEKEWNLQPGDRSLTVHPKLPEIENETPKKDLIGVNSLFSYTLIDPLEGLDIPRPSTTEERVDIEKSFDFYIDSVSNLPDDASIIKITGNFLNLGAISPLPPEIEAYPLLNSNARSPMFEHRMTINADEKASDPNLQVLIKIQTISKVDHVIQLLGSCRLPIFEQDTLRKGSHVLPLYEDTINNGDTGIESGLILASVRIPAMTISIRIQEHSRKYQSHGELSEIRQVDLPANVSEKRIIDTYSNSTETVQDVIKWLQKEENTSDLVDDTHWIQDRLDGVPVAALKLDRFIKYQPDKGMCISVRRAYGLPSNLYVQCFGRFLPVRAGPEEKFITLKHDENALKSAPWWTDEPKILKPQLHERGLILFQVFALDLIYKPNKNHKVPGQISKRNGKELSLDENAVLGWTVLSIFDGSYVNGQEHHLPIFRGETDADFLESLAEKSVLDAVKDFPWTKNNKFDAAALVVEVWDAHFDYQNLPHKPKKSTELLRAAGDVSAYNSADTNADGPHFYNTVLDVLEKKYKKQGRTSDIYKHEIQFYKEITEKMFYELLENALMDAGYGPL